MHRPGMSTAAYHELPHLGVGVALRSEIHQEIEASSTVIDWLELITEDFLFTPQRREAVCALRERFPLVPHGVELSIGSEEEPDPAYVDALADLVDLVQAPWCSDHLCFTRAGGVALNALVPLQRTREVAEAVARKAQRIQDRVGVPFLLENVSSYIDVAGGTWSGGFLQDNHGADVFGEVWVSARLALPIR